MIALPHPLSAGQALTARWLNRLLDALRARELRSGPGIELNRTGSGTTVSLAPALRLSHPAGEAIPATIDAPSNGSYVARLYRGGTQFAGTGRLVLPEVSRLAELPPGTWVLAHPTPLAVVHEGMEE